MSGFAAQWKAAKQNIADLIRMGPGLQGGSLVKIQNGRNAERLLLKANANPRRRVIKFSSLSGGISSRSIGRPARIFSTKLWIMALSTSLYPYCWKAG